MNRKELKSKVLLLIPVIAIISLTARCNVDAQNNGLALKPIMGWSSWSCLRTKPTEEKVKAQTDAIASKLKPHGYEYVNLDDFYYLDPETTVDDYGRWVVDTEFFPSGMKALGDYIHSKGLKFGLYVTPGIPKRAVENNTPIEGTGYHANDIAITSKFEKNYNFRKSMYYIDFTKPGAQEFIDSWARLFASYGVDFIKIDGVGSWDKEDVIAWSKALAKLERPIYLELSNELNIKDIQIWQQYSNGWRTNADIEQHGNSGNLTNWKKINQRFVDTPQWATFAGIGGWNDLDSMLIADGNKDGLTDAEKQSLVSLWAISSAQFYTGSDMVNADSYGLSLLTNDEVIAVNQKGLAGKLLSGEGLLQVWSKELPDGSYAVALFNLGSEVATVTVNFADFGLANGGIVRDLWIHTDLGSFIKSYSIELKPHASNLVKISPSK